MLNSDQSQLLLEFFVPVKYHFAAHAISNVQLSPGSPSSLLLNQNINISFNYTTNQTGGVRIFPRPFTNGTLSPNYAASGSPIYPVGNGTGNASFTITTGNVKVDSIRFQMYNSDQSSLLLEYFVPVTYHFGANAITNINFSPTPPAYFTFNANDSSLFNYTTNEVGGVRIFPRPFTKGALTPGYAASGSPIYATGSGSGNGYFTIVSGNVMVDQMRFQMWNASQSQLLLEFFVPVKFYYGNVALTGLEETSIKLPASFNILQNYPNPFNPSTLISYQIPVQSNVSIKVYDALGNLIKELVNEEKPAGNYQVEFDADKLASGIYFYRMQAGSFIQTKKMMLLR